MTMRPLLSELHCPYCGGSFEPIVDLPGEYGALQCGCAQFPVLEGIPILQHMEGLPEVVRLIKGKETTRALLKAMNVFRVRWAHRSRWHQAQYYFNCRRLTSRSTLAFDEAVQLVRKPRGFADYLVHRYANPSLLADMSLLPLIGGRLKEGSQKPSGPCRVLDLACGAGHSTFLMTHWFPETSVVAADQDFVSLYLAKRFLAPRAQYVCTDSEVPSPFPDNYFNVVHCLDAFHYFRSKQAIVTELRRVTEARALWLFPHLHNSLSNNVTAGIPLSPEHYARCFEFLDLLLFDEAKLLRRIVDRRTETAPEPSSIAELRQAQSIALVGNSASARLEQQPLSAWLRSNPTALRVNPVYRAEWRGDTLKLELQWPNEVLQRECQAIEALLPRTCEVKRDDVKSLLRGGGPLDERVLSDLVDRFVFVPMAANYVSQDAATRA